MLLYSMSVTLDGYINDRDGGIGYTAPTEELFAFHLERVRGIGAHLCGRRLYEIMLPWETDPAMRETELEAEFADVWSALPKVVFSRTLQSVEGNARLASSSIQDELATLQKDGDLDIEIGGAGLAAEAFQLGLIDELHIFRAPVVLGGGTPYFPPLSELIRYDLIETRTFEPSVVYEHYRRGSG